MKNKLLQIYYDLRHQPLIAWVTLLATSISICLLLVFSMINSVKTVPFAPETNRPRLLVSPYLHLQGINGSGEILSSCMTFRGAKQLYSDLEGIELVTIKTVDPEPLNLNGPSGESFTAEVHRTDANFFKVFDFDLLEGRYYTPQEADAMVKVAVVSESTARRLFGTAPAVGGTFNITYEPYRVIGIVRDTSPHATMAHADVFLPTGPLETSCDYGDWLGSYGAYMLAAPGTDAEDVRNQVRGLYADLSTRLAAENLEAVYHLAPYTTEEMNFHQGGSNNDPDLRYSRGISYVMYVILLLIPAINLGSMLHSRMRRRVSEYGVRRAYGCTRGRIMVDIVTENLIVTVAGAAVGFAAAILVAKTCPVLFGDHFALYTQAPPIGALLSWHTVCFAVGATLILNLLSAAVPAWKASRLNPVEAIKGGKS